MGSESSIDRVGRFSVELSRFVRLDRFQGLLGILNDYALYKPTHSLTHSRTMAKLELLLIRFWCSEPSFWSGGGLSKLSYRFMLVHRAAVGNQPVLSLSQQAVLRRQDIILPSDNRPLDICPLGQTPQPTYVPFKPALPGQTHPPFRAQVLQV